MLQNPCKTLGFKKNMVYKIPPRGGGKPYPASGLLLLIFNFCTFLFKCLANFTFTFFSISNFNVIYFS